MTRKLKTEGVEKPPVKLQKPMDYQRLKESLEGFIQRDCQDYSEDLDELILDTAKTGIVRLPWELLKPLFHYRLEKVLNSVFLGHYSENDEKPRQLLDQLNKFDNPPFTVQRICELLADPQKHYKRKDSYMRAMEKNLLVVSTQEADLTWMKSPRLAQLLEERPKPVVEEVKYSENLTDKEPTSHQNEEPPPTTTVWTTMRETVPKPLNDNGVASSTLPCTPSERGDMERERRGLAGRKRSSSSREELEGGTVLQEADSTVTIEQPQVESMEEVSPKKTRDNSDSETTSLKSLLERTLPNAVDGEGRDHPGDITTATANTKQSGLSSEHLEEMDTN